MCTHRIANNLTDSGTIGFTNNNTNSDTHCTTNCIAHLVSHNHAYSNTNKCTIWCTHCVTHNHTNSSTDSFANKDTDGCANGRPYCGAYNITNISHCFTDDHPDGFSNGGPERKSNVGTSHSNVLCVHLHGYQRRM